jgi:hypothetical protein
MSKTSLAGALHYPAVDCDVTNKCQFYYFVLKIKVLQLEKQVKGSKHMIKRISHGL